MPPSDLLHGIDTYREGQSRPETNSASCPTIPLLKNTNKLQYSCTHSTPHTNALSCMKVQTRRSSNELGTSAPLQPETARQVPVKLKWDLEPMNKMAVARASHTALLYVYPVSVHKGVLVYRWLVEIEDEG